MSMLSPPRSRVPRASRRLHDPLPSPWPRRAGEPYSSACRTPMPAPSRCRRGSAARREPVRPRRRRAARACRRPVRGRLPHPTRQATASRSRGSVDSWFKFGEQAARIVPSAVVLPAPSGTCPEHGSPPVAWSRSGSDWSHAAVHRTLVPEFKINIAVFPRLTPAPPPSGSAIKVPPSNALTCAPPQQHKVAT